MHVRDKVHATDFAQSRCDSCIYAIALIIMFPHDFFALKHFLPSELAFSQFL